MNASTSANEDGGGAIPGDLPQTMTEAVGEFGREVGGMLADRLKHENDAGLIRTMDRFLDSYEPGRPGPRAGDPDFNAAFGALADGKLLDDLALELFIDDLEFTRANPNVCYYGRINVLGDAIERHQTVRLAPVHQPGADAPPLELRVHPAPHPRVDGRVGIGPHLDIPGQVAIRRKDQTDILGGIETGRLPCVQYDVREAHLIPADDAL